jgi:hypothetical protein
MVLKEFELVELRAGRQGDLVAVGHQGGLMVLKGFELVDL